MDHRTLVALPAGYELWYRLGTGYDIPVTLQRAVEGALVEVARDDGSVMHVFASGLRLRRSRTDGSMIAGRMLS